MEAPWGLGRDQELEQLALGLDHPLAEPVVWRRGLQAGGQLDGRQLGHPLAHRALAAAWRPQIRSEPHGCSLDVEQVEPMPGEDTPGRAEGEVGEMLVVDGVELVALHQPARWGNSTVTTPPGLSSRAIPATKLLRSGTWAGRCWPPPGRPGGRRRPAAGQLLVEELGQGGDAALLGHLGHVAGRLDPEHRTPPATKCCSR